MGDYDGNRVTALWNYAQRFAISDNAHGTVFGATLLGHLNLISGQTNGILQTLNGSGALTNGGNGSSTVIANADPIGDVCGTTTKEELTMPVRIPGTALLPRASPGVGVLGGFDLSIVNPHGTTGCNRSSTSPYAGATGSDYGMYYDPFQFYPSTANPRTCGPHRSSPSVTWATRPTISMTLRISSPLSTRVSSCP
jgi:phospholipase C